MKALNKKYFFILLYLAVVCMACHKMENIVDDCNNIVIDTDEDKLVSPRWLVHVMDSLEKDTDKRERYFVYNVTLFDYQQQTYVQIGEILHGYEGYQFYTCSGSKISNPIEYFKDIDWMSDELNWRTPFAAYFCYEESCAFKHSTYRYY